ncbi:hemerythrin [Mariprofundus micogutta]|uniref:Hemerythrin n=1 Tax=Mariprofundus micogutta TaxID=1921010 RepID=A0A1L8CQ09_9PROT|nr:hemerythrin family protein [Mariprofundus micogutta]GAV20998.1 hemerythrin [Mariprofundus micogutta]
MKISADDFAEVPSPVMHDVHLEEVEMINAIYDLIEAVDAGSAEQARLTTSLDELLLHTQEHFANEERLMSAYHFPPYVMHKGAHDLFLAGFETIIDEWKSTRQLGPVRQFMCVELPAWMKQHINSMDYVTAGFIAGQS